MILEYLQKFKFFKVFELLQPLPISNSGDFDSSNVITPFALEFWKRFVWEGEDFSAHNPILKIFVTFFSSVWPGVFFAMISFLMRSPKGYLLIMNSPLIEGRTMNATFYIHVLDRLCKRIARMRPELWRDRKFFLLHNNACPHTAAIIQQFLAKKGAAQLSHPPYLPDLSPPSNYFAFPKLKLELKCEHYASIEDIQKSVTVKLKAFPISDFVWTMKRLKDHTECIQVSRDYFE